MNENGKLKEIFIEDDQYNIDHQTGMKTLSNLLVIWVDKDKEELIRKIPGISYINKTTINFKYNIGFDPRYDREFLKAEIEAVVKCAD